MARTPRNIAASSYDSTLLMQVHDYLIQEGPLRPVWDEINKLLAWYDTDACAVLKDQDKPFLLPEKASSPITKRILSGAAEARSNPEITKRLDDFLFITGAIDAIAVGMWRKACEGAVFDEKSAIVSLEETFATLSKRGMANLSLPHAAQVFYEHIKPSLNTIVADAVARVQKENRQLPVPVVNAPVVQRGRMDPTYVLMAKRDYFSAGFYQESVQALLNTMGKEAGLPVPLPVDKAMVVGAAAYPEVEAYLWPSAYRVGDAIMRKSPMDAELRKKVDDAVVAAPEPTVAQRRVADVMGVFDQIFGLALGASKHRFDAVRGKLVDRLTHAGIHDANEQVDMAYDRARELITMYRPSGQGRG